MNRKIEIVDATIEDAGDIGSIQSQTWLINYPNSKEGISRDDIAEKVNRWSQEGDDRIKTEITKPNAHTWVARLNGQTVGFIGVLKDEEGGRIDAIHVLPEYQGQGIGTKLFDTALAWLGNDRQIRLEVVSYNENAQSFYERYGFKKSGMAIDEITLPSGKIISKVVMIKN